ncbi:MAG TPA: ABC transporter permease subunit [Thermoleophilia bacterium]|nr:ABC transporter permease subunit [Thermoleophilia bacterium]
MATGSITAEPPERGAPPAAADGGADPGRGRRYLVAFAFLAPALAFLGVWVVYPTINTFVRSFYDRSGDSFIGFDNYVTLFTTDVLLTAIRNNAIWVLVVPATVTAIGLVFAVLTERIRWSVAFKTAVFMPMAISLFAAGVIWHIMYEKDPSQGTVNAAISVVSDAVNPPGVLAGARPSGDDLQGSAARGYTLQGALQPGQVAQLGLTGIRASDVADGVQAVAPAPAEGGITGVVWRDFKPGGGGTAGEVEEGEVGVPGVTLRLTDDGGAEVATATSGADGVFAFEGLSQGGYTVGISSQTFRQPFAGVPWLGPRLITPAIIIAYIWVWAGFAMVVIAAGLAAIPRDVLEAARTDGATEWQVFRRVTVPLLAPVLSVVFITMIINVLKVFDIILSVAPASVQDDVNVIALAMWRTSFGGVNDFGLGSAIAAFLFLLVIPVLLLNVRRFRREA